MAFCGLRSVTHSDIPLWKTDSYKNRGVYKNLCLVSVVVAFSVGLVIGIFIPLVYTGGSNNNVTMTTGANASEVIRTIFLNNSYAYKSGAQLRELNEYPTVSFIDNMILQRDDDDLIQNGIYWGRKIEESLPEGYSKVAHQNWSDYVQKSTAVRLQNGCGRMQNRLVTFQDGHLGCVRYRQNTDQIQGELFSFYLAQILELPNLAPSTVSVVDLKSPLWQNLATEIAAAQWNSNRPIVLTKFIKNLDPASIPGVFKPSERHLNKNDILGMGGEQNLMKTLVELAQWSDLIIFDYLTANLDRIVNNLYNYQWNVNIMDAPAHNLAKKLDNNLLVFLDNESGLLHGYRLLKKYEIYHSLLLDNLCVFRRKTAAIIARLKKDGDVGRRLRGLFEKQNSDRVKDVLPTLPDKSIKILNERIDRVHAQITKCEAKFSKDQILR